MGPGGGQHNGARGWPTHWRLRSPAQQQPTAHARRSGCALWGGRRPPRRRRPAARSKQQYVRVGSRSGRQAALAAGLVGGRALPAQRSAPHQRQPKGLDRHRLVCLQGRDRRQGRQVLAEGLRVSVPVVGLRRLLRCCWRGHCCCWCGHAVLRGVLGLRGRGGRPRPRPQAREGPVAAAVAAAAERRLRCAATSYLLAGTLSLDEAVDGILLLRGDGVVRGRLELVDVVHLGLLGRDVGHEAGLEALGPRPAAPTALSGRGSRLCPLRLWAGDRRTCRCFRAWR